jgi:hypothetical protein
MMLVTIWCVLSKQEAYRYASEEDLACKMLLWSWSISKEAHQGMTRQQFAKYGLCCYTKAYPKKVISYTRFSRL